MKWRRPIEIKPPSNVEMGNNGESGGNEGDKASKWIIIALSKIKKNREELKTLRAQVDNLTSDIITLMEELEKLKKGQ